MGYPIVSVIIPTYNRAHLVDRAIKSVLNQTYQDYEIIIVNDCSKDNTEEAVKGFRDERIIYICHEENKGGSAARNTGIKSSRGEYIALLDDDDEWLPEKLEKQVNKFKTSSGKVGVIYGGHITISDKTGKIVDRWIPTARGVVYPYTLSSGPGGGGSIFLIKKECFQKIGFYDETLPACQDWDLKIRLSKYYEFDFVPDVLENIHIHGGQLTTDLNAKIQARKKLMEKHYDDLSKYPAILSDCLNRLGILYCLSGSSKESRLCFLRSIKKRPLQRFAYIHLFIILLVPKIYRNVLQIKLKKGSTDGVQFYI